jgi:hypothetical protein
MIDSIVKMEAQKGISCAKPKNTCRLHSMSLQCLPPSSASVSFQPESSLSPQSCTSFLLLKFCLVLETSQSVELVVFSNESHIVPRACWLEIGRQTSYPPLWLGQWVLRDCSLPRLDGVVSELSENIWGWSFYEHSFLAALALYLASSPLCLKRAKSPIV